MCAYTEHARRGSFAKLVPAIVLVLGPLARAGWIDFTNETSQRLIAAAEYGVDDSQEKDYAWGDVDHDGDLDVVCVRKQPFTTPGRRANVLFMHEGVADGQPIDGVFVDRTDEFIPEFRDLTNDRDVALVDVDGDAWLDIVTATTLSDGLPKSISHPRVYINLGTLGGVWQGFIYEEARIPQLRTVAGLEVAPRFCAVAVGDVTGDGAPDLYFADYDSGPSNSNEPPAWDLDDRLLVNDGVGYFTDATADRMDPVVSNSSFAMSADIVDMNQDGLLDIVRDTALEAPYHVSVAYNDPDAAGSFPLDWYEGVYSLAPYHMTVGNLDNNAWPDMVVQDDGHDRYLINHGVGSDGMADFSTHILIGSEAAEFGGNLVIADLDNDGWNDVYVCDVDVDIPGCNRGTRIYHNLADVPIVTLIEQDAPFAWAPDGVFDVAIFDIDGDGWNDLFLGTCSTTQIWINSTVAVAFIYPDGIPEHMAPDVAASFTVTIETVHGDTVPGTVMQHVAVDDGPFVATPMPKTGPDEYLATLPATPCAGLLRFYFSAQASNGTTFADPPDAPAASYLSLAAVSTRVMLDETFENPATDWTVDSVNLDAGAWEQVDPNGTTYAGDTAQPEDDAGDGGDHICFITQQSFGGAANNNDVDGGPTALTSPVIDLQGVDAMISYTRWQFSADGVPDALTTQITNDGMDWVDVDATVSTAGAWETHFFRVGAHVEPTSDVRVRFVSTDQPNDSVTESGIDNVRVTELLCADVAPEILHGLNGVSFENAAFGGYIDPRIESDNGVDVNLGIDRVVIVFTEPVTAIGGGALTADAFMLIETGGATPPNIAGLESIDDRTVRLTLDRAITVQEWLTVTAAVQDLAGIPIANLGNLGPGVDEPDRVDIGFLPADVDQSGSVNPVDLLRFKQYVNGVFLPPGGANVDFIDTDRSGGVNPLDLLAFKRVINGVPPATRSWSGASMNSTRP